MQPEELWWIWQQEQAEKDRGGRQVHRTQGVLAFGQLFPRANRRTSGRLQRVRRDAHVVCLLTALLKRMSLADILICMMCTV